MRGVEIALETAPRSVPLARRWLTEVLGPASRFDTDVARLRLSELVTSAVLEARTGLCVRVAESDARLRVEVAGVPARPASRPTHPGTPQVDVVAALADACGASGGSADGPATTTWFELLPAASPWTPETSSGAHA